jgi:hypothetical protein
MIDPDHIQWKYYIVYCCWLAFEGVFCYICTCFTSTLNPEQLGSIYITDIIETKNRSLEETAALFDGEEATEQIAHLAQVRIDEPHEKHSDSFQENKTAA